MNARKLLLRSCVLGAVTLFVSTYASADALLRHARNQLNYSFTQPATVFVPLQASGALQTANFSASGNLQVTYEAECAVGAAAGNTTTWLNIDIILYNAATGAPFAILAPTNGANDALCTADGSAGANGWRRSSMTGLATALPIGVYFVRVRANIQNGVAGNTGWLGDSTLLVWK